MAKIYSYFDSYRDDPFKCPDCGWTGRMDKLELEQYRDCFDGSCPNCDKKLMIVSFPTAEEIRAAAAAGIDEARQMLLMVESREELVAAAERENLKSADQLPDLPGACLEFSWDQVTEGQKEYTLICSAGAVIWREPTFYEGWPRFNKVKEILKARYGARFKSLIPTEKSELYLYGDDLMAPQKISFY